MHAADLTDGGGHRSDATGLWLQVDRMLDHASPDGASHHGLGALAARRLRALGRPVPESLAREARTASVFAAIAPSLLERIRGSCDGPLVLFKGPEIARLYPSGGRGFSDVDLLTPDPDSVQRSLLEAGFVADELGVEATYHLQPLLWPALPLKIEIHRWLKSPRDRRSVSPGEILEASVPSALGIEGIRAPSAAHHALVLAAHSWEHRPLRMLRDLVDVAAVCTEADRAEIERVASAWELREIWATTWSTVDALFYRGTRTFPLRSWARHLREVRDATVIEAHLEHWLSPYSEMPARRALANTAQVLREEFMPLPGETWRDKLTRSAAAFRDASLPLGAHDAQLDSRPARPPESGAGSTGTRGSGG